MSSIYNTNQLATWMIINTTTDEMVVKQVYKYYQQPFFNYLYEQTCLDSEKKQGPLVVRIDESDKLCQEINVNPQQWDAMFIYTHVDKEHLLSHLKNLLLVRFEQEEKGILNYFHSRVASYFFKMPEEQLSYWLGPIKKLSWYGGTWQDKFYQTETKQEITNPSPQNAISFEPTLTEELTNLLYQCEQEQIIYRFSHSLKIDFKDTLHYQKEANLLGLKETSEFRQYLLLRMENSNQPIPSKKLIGTTVIEKLINLKKYWQENSGVIA